MESCSHYTSSHFHIFRSKTVHKIGRFSCLFCILTRVHITYANTYTFSPREWERERERSKAWMTIVKWKNYDLPRATKKKIPQTIIAKSSEWSSRWWTEEDKDSIMIILTINSIHRSNQFNIPGTQRWWRRCA